MTYVIPDKYKQTSLGTQYYKNANEVNQVIALAKDMLVRMKDLASGLSHLPVSVQLVPDRGTFITYSLSSDGRRIGATINIDLRSVVSDIRYVIDKIKKTNKSYTWFDVESIVKRNFYHELAHLLLTESNGTNEIYSKYKHFFKDPLKFNVYEKVIGTVFNSIEDARIETQVIKVYPGMEKYFKFSYGYMIDDKINPLIDAASKGDLGSLLSFAFISPFVFGVGFNINDLHNTTFLPELSKMLTAIEPYCTEAASCSTESACVEKMAQYIWPPIRDFIDKYYEAAKEVLDAEDEGDGQGKGQSSNNGQQKPCEGEDGQPCPGQCGKPCQGGAPVDAQGNKHICPHQKGTNGLQKNSNDKDKFQDIDVGSKIDDDLDLHEHTTGGKLLTTEELLKVLEQVDQLVSAGNPIVQEVKQEKNYYNSARIPELTQYNQNVTTERNFINKLDSGACMSSGIKDLLIKEDMIFKERILPSLRKVLQDNERMGYTGAFNSGKHLNKKRIMKYVTQNDLRIFQRAVAQKKKSYVFHFLVDGSGSMGSFNVHGAKVSDEYLTRCPCLMTAVVSYCFANALQQLNIPVKIDVWDSGGYYGGSIKRPNGLEDIGIHVSTNDLVLYREVKGFDENITRLFGGQEDKFLMFMGNGGTPEYDAVGYGIEQLSKRQETVKILVILTDGSPGSSVGSQQQKDIITNQLYPKADKYGINIFAIGFGHQGISHHRNCITISQSVLELKDSLIKVLREIIN